jgi:uncharacterized damage-inducible protein DinB
VRSDDILTQFEFLFWLRDRALAKSADLSVDEFLDPATVAYRDLRSTLVHELDVERSWRLRLQGAPTEVWDIVLEATEFKDVATIADAWQSEEADALEWLSALGDDELASPVTANQLEGFALSTYLEHVVMHGVESFSAAAILLHRTGHSMGDVGFLDFIDTLGRATGSHAV